jgi:hypothetical protein
VITKTLKNKIELVNRELSRHLVFVVETEKHLFQNPIHLKGVDAYNDKKTIYQLKNKVSGGKLLQIEDLQFLETIHEKY